MFCAGPELEEMYGPTLAGFIRGLTSDETVSVVAKPKSGYIFFSLIGFQ